MYLGVGIAIGRQELIATCKDAGPVTWQKCVALAIVTNCLLVAIDTVPEKIMVQMFATFYEGN